MERRGRGMLSEQWLSDGGGEGAKAVLVLAHGAGGPMDSSFMTEMTRALVCHGVWVVRFEFPYMGQRRVDGKRRFPNKLEVLREVWCGVYVAVKRATELPLYIGGKSMGGRIASLVADELEAAGLVCLGYPFHPPKRPEKTRIEHLAGLKTPTLILQGTRDPFGTPVEVAGYHLSESIEVDWVEDGDHSFKPRKRSGYTLDQNIESASARIARFILG
jgi:hypothetical protein